MGVDRSEPVRASGEVLAAEERVSVDEALRMITINAAYTLGAGLSLVTISAS